jgi:hypothetical protein
LEEFAFMIHRYQQASRSVRTIVLLPMLATAACATAPPQQAHQTESPPPPPTQVYVYQNNGQSAAQLDRDRYECHVWAVKQSGFDPSVANVAPSQRVQVVAGPPPGTGVAAGAATGAVLGAVISHPYEAGAGAAIGAVAGAMIGAAADASRQEQAERVQSHYDAAEARRQAHVNQLASDYRRAISACLEGRGYTVK